MTCLGEVVVKALIVEVDEDIFLFVRDDCYEFFDSFGERLLALVVVGEVGVEIEGFFFFCVEKLKDLYQYLAYLGVEFDMVFGLFAHFLRKKLQTVLYLLVAFRFEFLLHIVQTIVELKKANQTANYFNLQKAFLLDFVIRHTIVNLRNLSYDVHQLFDFQRYF